jgi:hypothetical protein
MLGCVHEIWVLENSQIVHVVLNPYNWLPDDTILNMPAVQRQDHLVVALATVCLSYGR